MCIEMNCVQDLVDKYQRFEEHTSWKMLWLSTNLYKCRLYVCDFAGIIENLKRNCTNSFVIFLHFSFICFVITAFVVTLSNIVPTSRTILHSDYGNVFHIQRTSIILTHICLLQQWKQISPNNLL